jgi:hypothetical protein
VIFRLLVMLMFVSVPVCGQSRVITNADLGKPFSWKAPPASADMLASLAAHQFVALPQRSYGPTFVVIAARGSSGPWHWPEPAPQRRLDGTLLSAPPWSVTTRLPWFPLRQEIPSQRTTRKARVR